MSSVKHKTKQWTIISTIVLIACIALISLMRSHRSTTQNCVKLNARIELDGTKITITNNDDFDYTTTELYINKHYKLIGFNLMAGESTSLWQVEFANYLRRRMPLNEKVLTFSIISNLNDGSKGYYYTEFKK